MKVYLLLCPVNQTSNVWQRLGIKTSNINGINFIDLNKSIANQYENVDFYVDYCHLTADANLIVAKILSEKISEILEEKNLIETK